VSMVKCFLPIAHCFEVYLSIFAQIVSVCTLLTRSTISLMLSLTGKQETEEGRTQSRLIEGTCEGFVTRNCKISLINYFWICQCRNLATLGF